MSSCFSSTTLLLLLVIPVVPSAKAVTPTDAALERRFEQSVKPFLATYCAGCHANDKPAAAFDIRPYSTMKSVVDDPGHWAIMLDRVRASQMPPKGMKQPPAEARKQFVDWIQEVRTHEARKNAGDPGMVLARRLSNSEYNYTIRDLTGVDIRPAREFPVDPANTEGFDNSGESLAMSPALLRKYLQAAREVANHMVLKPTGMDFAPHPMLVETDREKYTIQRIVDFYKRQPTDYADYFLAAWRYKNRAALGKPRATLASIAAESKVSAKYLPIIWQYLETTKEEVGPGAKLQAMWKALPAAKANQPDLAREQCVDMRNYVKKMRFLTARHFASPKMTGLSNTSQPLMNWKLRQYAASRRDFDRAALLVEGEPEPQAPAMPRDRRSGADGTAMRWMGRMVMERLAEPELKVPAGQRPLYEAAYARFANVFPDAFYVSERGRFYPDNSEDKGRLLSAGFHNVMGYTRDDTPLIELILDEKGKQELQTLWDEFDFVADYTTRTYIEYFFNQSGEILGKGRESGSVRPPDKEVTAEPIIFGLREQYITKFLADPKNNPIALDAIKEHFSRVNATIRSVEKMRAESEPHHMEALLKFASRAFRRPLTQVEREDLLSYYKKIRNTDGLTHEEAIRDSVVYVLMSPEFCYRVDALDTRLNQSPEAKLQRVAFKSPPTPASTAKPLSDYALASRLSYFLWSSMPDDELLAKAAAGELRKTEVLVAQARRMLKDPRANALATEFAGNWLDFRRFEQHNAVDRERFPAFDNDLRQAMFEEPVRFIDDVIRNDRSVLDMVYGKHTFVNANLAKHYGMPAPAKAGEWVRVDDAKKYGRGGLLPMAVFLTQNSPGLRTSPVKRGYWVVRRVLGEVIPPPPPSVPELPQDEAKIDLPLRDMLAKHRQDPGCASCHARFDSFGLVFEGYGPVGEARAKDLAGRPVDTRAEFPGGAEGSGIEGVQKFIKEKREKNFLDNLSRKLLAYALGRSLQLSDEPTLERMQTQLAANGYRFSPLVETIVTSPQFRTKRSSAPIPPQERQKGD